MTAKRKTPVKKDTAIAAKRRNRALKQNGEEGESKTLKEFMDESMKTRKRHGNFASYKRWPQEAKNDIRQMVECNDAGTASLTIKDAISWLSMKYEIDATKATIMTFLEREMGRATWMK
jgi:hypothetical protein